MRNPSQTGIFLYVILFAALAGCKRPEDANHVSHQPSGAMFPFVETGTIETLDPMQIIYLVDWQYAFLSYEGLVGYEANSANICPLLSESWTTSDKGPSTVFTLRPDVYFQDDPCFPNGKGRRFSAQDVIHTFERLKAHSQDCPLWYLLDGKIRKIEALDSLHVLFELSAPYATFLKILASPAMYIVPEEAVQYYGDLLSHHPVGTGPFRLARWKPFQQLLYVRHEQYWRHDVDGNRLPHLSGLDISLKPNDAIAFSDFLKGKSRLIRIDERFSLNLAEQGYDPNRYQIITAPLGLITRFFGFSMNNGSPFATHPELRRAIATAFDPAKLSEKGDKIPVLPARSLVPSYFLGEEKIPEYDHGIDSAQALWISGGTGNTVLRMTLMSNVESSEIPSFRQSLYGFPIDFDVQMRPTNYFESIRSERPDLFRVAALPGFPDPEEYYSLFYSKSTEDVNLTGYASPEFDALFESSLVEQDPEKRNDLFLAMEALLRRDAPVIYLSHGKPATYLVPKFVNGLTMRFNLLDFSEVTADQSHVDR